MPTTDDLKSLQYSFDGSPFCQVDASFLVNTNTLQYSFDGSPFWALSPPNDGTWSNKVIKVYEGGQWVSKLGKVYVTGSWIQSETKTY